MPSKTRGMSKKSTASVEEPKAETKPSASPGPDDDGSDADKYMMFQRSDDEGGEDDETAAANNNNDDAQPHPIPKSPDRRAAVARGRSTSMRGGRPGAPASLAATMPYRFAGPPPASRAAPHKYSPPLSMPSWGSMDEHGHEDYTAKSADGSNVITPAQSKLAKVHPSMFMYPPSSPIKLGPSPPNVHNTKQKGEDEDDGFDGGEEWLPPQSTKSRVRGGDASTREVVTMSEGGEGETVIKPQFVREPQGGAATGTPPHYRPSLVVDTSHSHDSSETPGRSLQGGRIQVVGGGIGREWHPPASSASSAPWSLVSHSRSAESGASEEWEPPRAGVTVAFAPPHHLPVATPDRAYSHYPQDFRGHPPPPHHLYHHAGILHSSSSHSSGDAPPPVYSAPYPPPPSAAGYYSYGGRYPPYPHPYPATSYPHHGLSPEEEVEEEDEEEPHPLLKGYNPHQDGVRPQFSNTKKAGSPSTRFVAADGAPGGLTQRKRRRRDPEEKIAAASAMAAKALAAAAKVKERREKKALKEKDSSSSSSEDELKIPGSDDEDVPSAARSAIASAVALRAAAAGSPLQPPKAAAEVDFDIADPPLEPIHPPSSVANLESASMMSDNDVLCGRGGGTNSQMGNRRYRALVRDFQPTYLMARRREKPLMARSVVLIVRRRGGRFLRRDDSDGRLYEVGDEKAEAKTSQALREGLDVRATKSAANALLGTDASKKQKRIDPVESMKVASTAPVIKSEARVKPPTAQTHVPPRVAYYGPPRTHPGAPPPHHYFPPLPHHRYPPKPYYRHPYPQYDLLPSYPPYPPPRYGYAVSSPQTSGETRDAFSPPRANNKSHPPAAQKAPLTPVHSRVEARR